MKKNGKEKLLSVRDFILAHGKIIFPILLVAAVAVTVTAALKANSNKATAISAAEKTDGTDAEAGEDTEAGVPDHPLELNAYPAVNELISAYYEATAEGDADAIASIQSSVGDLERIRIQELGKYIESYPEINVYTKPGPEEGSYIVIAYTKVVLSYYPEDLLPGYVSFYVCPREDGSLYINQEIVPEEVSEYIRKVMLQDDIVELYNKITVEYKEICIEKPEIFNYIATIEDEVQTSAGVILAQQNSEVSGDVAVPEIDMDDPDADEFGEGGDEPGNIEPTGPTFAMTTATVNVRSSDSMEADTLGRVKGGTEIEVLEVKVNGWSHVSYEGKDGYIKSEFLSIIETVADVEVIGSVTTTADVNVRLAPSTSAKKLGIAKTGTVLELVSDDGEWCKVIYDNQIGYVKMDYVEK